MKIIIPPHPIPLPPGERELINFLPLEGGGQGWGWVISELNKQMKERLVR
jgi:hypothetical protein